MKKLNSKSLALTLLLLAVFLVLANTQDVTSVEAIRHALLSGQTEKALELANAAAESKPDDATILGLQALAAERNNHVSIAEVLAKKALKAMPGQPEASFALAEIAHGRGHFEAAISHGSSAVKGAFKGEALLIVADAQKLIGNASAAAKLIKEALPHITHLPEVRQTNVKGLLEFLNHVGDITLYQFSGSGVSKIPANIVQTKVNVPVKVNGADAGEFVIDTGNAGHVAITNALAEKLGLKKLGVQKARGADSSFEVWLSIIDSLSIGKFTIRNVPVVVTDTAHGSRAGNIGRNILLRFNTAIDYANGAVYFASPGTSPISSVREKYSEKMRLPYLYRLLMLVNIRLDEFAPASFAFDTGAPTFIIAESYSKQLGLSPVEGAQPMMARGAGGKTVAITPMHVGELDLGNSTWPLSRALAMKMQELRGLQPVPFHGIVGVDLFQGGILEFNMDSDEIIFYEPLSKDDK